MPNVQDAIIKTLIVVLFALGGFVFFKKSLLKIAEYF
jgi:hypothetical protein